MFARQIFISLLAYFSVMYVCYKQPEPVAVPSVSHFDQGYLIAKLERRMEYQARIDKMKTAVLAKYDVDEDVVNQAVIYALKYERPKFPRAEHMIALIGIESSWRPSAKSALETDPAVGLTQIRPGIWKDKIGDAKKLNRIEYQIKYSIEILDEYHARIRHQTGTLLAYNVGLTAYREMRYNDFYVVKFKREIKTLQLEV